MALAMPLGQFAPRLERFVSRDEGAGGGAGHWRRRKSRSRGRGRGRLRRGRLRGGGGRGGRAFADDEGLLDGLAGGVGGQRLAGGEGHHFVIHRRVDAAEQVAGLARELRLGGDQL